MSSIFDKSSPWMSIALLGTGAALGGGVVYLYNWQKKHLKVEKKSRRQIQSVGDEPMEGDVMLFSSNRVRKYLMHTYKYVFLEVVGLAGTAYGAYKLGLVNNVLDIQLNRPWTSLFLFFVLPCAGLFGVLSIPKRKVATKHVALALTVGSLGVAVSPLVSLVPSSALVAAGGITTGIFGVLSMVALVAPSTTFIGLGGPLSIGCLLLSAAGISQLFLKGSSLRAMQSMELYVGLGLISGFLLYDTQRVIAKAEQEESDEKLDPMRESIGVFLDTLDIFMRVLLIDQNNKKRRRNQH